MNSSICDWLEPWPDWSSPPDILVSSSPAPAFMVTATFTTAGVTLAARSAKSWVASPAMAGVVISIGATRAGAVSAVESASAAKSFFVLVIGNLLFELAGNIWAPPHGAPMAGTLNVCIVGLGASGAKKGPQNKD